MSAAIYLITFTFFLSTSGVGGDGWRFSGDLGSTGPVPS
jgi:hypothetical protein